MEFTYLYCKNNCCKLKYLKNGIFNFYSEPANKYSIKCGSIILNSDNKILLSQSYNSYWGLPKGSQEFNEPFHKVCIRETYEETGLKISLDQIEASSVYVFFIKRKLYVFYLIKLNTNNIETEIPEEFLKESTGCGWISIECVKNLIKQNTIRVNMITKIVLKFLSDI